MAYCRKCGAQLAEDVKFCPNCGTPVEPIQENKQGSSYGNSGFENYNTPDTQPGASGYEIQGKKEATRSMVLGIIGVVLLFFGFTSIVSFILGIIGLVQASHAKQDGCMDGYRTAGFVLSLISTVGGAVVFVIVLVVLIIVGTAFGIGMSAFSHAYGIHDMMFFIRSAM